MTYGYDSGTDATTINIMAGITAKSPITFVYTGNVFNFSSDVVNTWVIAESMGLRRVT